MPNLRKIRKIKRQGEENPSPYLNLIVRNLLYFQQQKKNLTLRKSCGKKLLLKSATVFGLINACWSCGCLFHGFLLLLNILFYELRASPRFKHSIYRATNQSPNHISKYIILTYAIKYGKFVTENGLFEMQYKIRKDEEWKYRAEI